MANIAQFETFDQTKRNKLIAELKSGKRIITFTKADGSIATQEGTLNETLMPASMHSGFANRAENMEIISFYSLTRREWRSFRVDRLITLE